MITNVWLSRTIMLYLLGNKNNMNTQEIINALKEVDGETLEHIIREIGMEDQMLRQLIMKTDSNNVIELLNEILTFSDIVELERGELI